MGLLVRINILKLYSNFDLLWESFISCVWILFLLKMGIFLCSARGFDNTIHWKLTIFMLKPIVDLKWKTLIHFQFQLFLVWLADFLIYSYNVFIDYRSAFFFYLKMTPVLASIKLEIKVSRCWMGTMVVFIKKKNFF